jgi:hypothetical protein
MNFLSWNTCSQMSFFNKIELHPWSLDVRRALNATFPSRWIGRDGPTDWPPRSPDIMQLDFFFGRYVKDRIYTTNVQDFETFGPGMWKLPVPSLWTCCSRPGWNSITN